MFYGIKLGPFDINMYGVCALVGIFAACPPAIRIYGKRTGDRRSMLYVLMWSVVGIFFGMHLLYGVTNIKYWLRIFETPDLMLTLKRFVFVFGGSVFYGGLLGGLAVGWLAIKLMALPSDIVTDCAAPTIALFHGFARIGCFCSGCCYGKEWEHGIVFYQSPVKSANGVPRVPVQLFEAGFEFLLAAVLFALLFVSWKTGRLQGRLLAIYLTAYPLGRFALEFFRGDEYRGFIFGLSTSQFISIPVFICAVLYLISGRRKKRSEIAENC